MEENQPTEVNSDTPSPSSESPSTLIDVTSGIISIEAASLRRAAPTPETS